MDEKNKPAQTKRLAKLRREAHSTAYIGLIFGVSLILVASCIFIFLGSSIEKMRRSSNVTISNLASAVKWFVLVIVPCGAMSLIQAIYTIRYFRAERKIRDSVSTA